MTTNHLCRFVLGVASWFLVAPAHAEPEIIAQARAFIGEEAALSAVRSLRFVGTLVTAHPVDASKQTRASVEIFFQKPAQQRITITYEKAFEQTALDDYEAWQRQQDPSEASQWRLSLLSIEQVKRLRANTLENLAFFRGLDRQGVRIEDQGPVTIDGLPCEKIAFIHAPNIIFTRYFEIATGRLRLTETEAGGSIREQGEITVNTLRFPKKIITLTPIAHGKSQTVTITFDQISVNETFPSTFFAVPALSNR
jgi:hypothetical protein